MTLPVFETERLTLRPRTAHDAEGLHSRRLAAKLGFMYRLLHTEWRSRPC